MKAQDAYQSVAEQPQTSAYEQNPEYHIPTSEHYPASRSIENTTDKKTAKESVADFYPIAETKPLSKSELYRRSILEITENTNNLLAIRLAHEGVMQKPKR